MPSSLLYLRKSNGYADLDATRVKVVNRMAQLTGQKAQATTLLPLVVQAALIWKAIGSGVQVTLPTPERRGV